MVTATEWLKKAEAKRSKNKTEFKAVRRRAWDYADTSTENKTEVTPAPLSTPDEPEKIWEQNQEQTGNKYRNNWEQTGNESGNNIRAELGTTRNEISNNVRTVLGTNGNEKKNEYRNEIRNEVVVKTEKKRVLDSTSSLDDDSAQRQLLTLTGHQKAIMKQVTSHLKFKVGGVDHIDIIPTVLAMKINASLDVTRVTLKRLAEKKLLVKIPGERGRNGCCRFIVKENIVKFCFVLFNDAPCDINHIGNEIGNNNRNEIVYSSSNINNITTTMLPNNWEQIDFSSLLNIGFSKLQLQQLYERGASTPEIVQESINHFAYGLLNTAKVQTYTDPLNVLMGVLRKGQAWRESAYVEPKTLALQHMLEDKRKQKEQYDSMLKELIELEFPAWRNKLTEEEIKNIVPLDVRKTNMTAAIQASLRTYFTETVLLPRLNQNSITS